MEILKTMESEGFEQVVFCCDPKVGLKAIIALHSTVLGPATGGVRMWNYVSESEALHDVLRLSKGMTYKASVAGLNWGGGKAVIIGDAKTHKTPGLLERFGEFVTRLGGLYITAKDVGMSAEDLRTIKRTTPHILGIHGEAGSSGDPSPATAFGVYKGMKACVEHARKNDSLRGLRVAIQGLGSVSYALIEYLQKEGAEVIGCDIDAAAVEKCVNKYGIKTVSPEEIFDVECDIFSPSAMGGAINSKSIEKIKAGIIAGAANNQLASSQEGAELFKRGTIYAPDYVINGGGLINIYYEDAARGGYNRDAAFEHVAKIGPTIKQILERSEKERTPTHVVADRMAEERVEAARRAKQPK